MTCLSEAFGRIQGTPKIQIVVVQLASDSKGCFDGKYIFVNRQAGLMRVLRHELGHQLGNLCDETAGSHAREDECPNCLPAHPAPRGCGGRGELERTSDTCVMGAAAGAADFCAECRNELVRRGRGTAVDVAGESWLLEVDLARPGRFTQKRSRLAPQTSERLPFRYVAVARDRDNRAVAFATTPNRPFRERAYVRGIHALTVDYTESAVRVRIPLTTRGPVTVSVMRVTGPLPDELSLAQLDEAPLAIELPPVVVNPL
jgi:hypothetical protein